jgi:arylsulfatase A-like enzyme
MKADIDGMRRLGLEPDSDIGARVAECGFDIFERDDGMRPQGPDGFYDEAAVLKYNEYLRERGYAGDNPWHDYANSGIDDADNVLSGWFLNNSDLPANIREEDSVTPYLTRRGMDFIEAQGDEPWCCHLSYIKPHWPYIVPPPYHDMYGPNQFLPPVRSKAEYDNAHPVFKGFMKTPVGRAFSRDDVREKVMKAYMGLIKQCDDQMGVLFDWLEKTGRMDDTMIVVTSDHGDFLGDHWLGEKTFFQDASTKVPLIIYDPSPAANVTRGTVCDELVESIDLVPTFSEVAGGNISTADHILEGKSLVPVLHGQQDGPLRDFVICEYDYSATPLAGGLGLNSIDARMFMIADKGFKLVHFEGGFRPMLFDLSNDPDELNDLGASEAHRGIVDEFYDKLFAWTRRLSQRTTLSNQGMSICGKAVRTTGVLVGVVDEDDIPNELTIHYRGRKAVDKREKRTDDEK